MTLSEALKEAYATNPNNDIILNTIEIRHTSFSTPIRVVLDNQNHSLTLEDGSDAEFVAGYFDVVLPSVKENELGQVRLNIDGVSREIAQYIEQASESNDVIEATFRLYLNSNKQAPEMDPVEGFITNITVDVFRVTGNITFTDYINKEFPVLHYSAKTFPGLT